MNGRRVELLTYEFVSLDDRHDFSQAAVWQGDLGGFDCRLDGGTLEARPRDQYSDTETARQVLEPHLRAWALWSELNDGIRVRFTTGGSRVVDTAGGAVHVEVEMASEVGIASDVTFKVGHGEYPSPSPKLLVPSPLVEELLDWVRDLRERRLPMLVVAYLFLTRLEFEYNGRDQAATSLYVSRPVLDKLGILSERNDPTERRKVKRRQPALTPAEREWISAALPRLTRHIAEIEAGSAPPQLNMGDPGLPRL